MKITEFSKGFNQMLLDFLGIAQSDSDFFAVMSSLGYNQDEPAATEATQTAQYEDIQRKDKHQLIESITLSVRQMHHGDQDAVDIIPMLNRIVEFLKTVELTDKLDWINKGLLKLMIQVGLLPIVTTRSYTSTIQAQKAAKQQCR